ncbi:unnamed protein product [Bursaphelenchus xylophilus]|uniref:Glycogen debranching enzyme n=1 Tax=Bursaphelenchus xylophilus TaxID=6326 RepID=A0A1I7SRL4_BURXY|nr:unnamed protein product [Bursaphelenchus xylophilus]CAG9102195.1 unnamed protein product [Bursaphelenchus xylophilus]
MATHEGQTYLIELNAGEKLDSKVTFFKKGWTARFRAGKKLLGRKLTLKIPKLEKVFQFPELKSISDFDFQVELVCETLGCFKYEFTVDGDPDSNGHGYFTVQPEWEVNGQKLSLNSLAVQTYLTKLLGPLSEWKDRLQVAKESGYNVIHLTPVQVLGVSNSSYSIADFQALNPTLGDVTIEDLAEFVEFLEKEWSILTIQDVVWNHAARNAPWLQEHPECAYNCANSPHLRPAFIIDQALRLFSEEIAENKWEDRGIPAEFNSGEHLQALRNALLTQVLPEVRLEEFFQVDVTKIIDEFQQHVKNNTNSAVCDCPLALIQDPEFKRFGSTIDFQLASNIFNNDIPNLSEEQRLAKNVDDLRNALEALNENKRKEVQGHIEAIVNATLGHVAYERVDGHGLRVPRVTKERPLTTNYFVYPFDVPDIKSAETQAYDRLNGEFIMACNGWVMNADPLKNFAEPHSQVYLRRELVAWGDSIKLNYGYKPSDCPYLWDYMLQYTESCVKIFHGVRIDNCHSTPIHVAEYLLEKARIIRPGLYVMAELFTGSEDLDNLFVNRLGITSLIREAQNAPDSHEQGRFVHRFGGDPVGAFRTKTVKPAPFSVAHALFYDQTHDNPAAAEKRTIYDYLPTAAMISMAYCAAASTRGYDEFIPFHIHVVTEKRPYRKWSEIQANPSLKGLIEARKKLNELHVELCALGYSEVFVDQYNVDVVAITRHNPVTRESVLLIAHCCFGPFKWIPDGADHKGIPVADDITEILFELKTVEDGGKTKEAPDAEKVLSGVQNIKVEVYEHVPIDKSLAVQVENGVIKFRNFPSGSVVAFKIVPKPKTLENCKDIDNLATSHELVDELQNALLELDLQQLNYILFFCEPEEGTQFGTGAYDIPAYGKLVYCGLKGVEALLRKVQAHNDLGHPLCGNLRAGTWLPNYYVNRLKRTEKLKKVAEIFERAFKPLDEIPHFLRPCYFEEIFTVLYQAVETTVLNKIGYKSKLPINSTIVEQLSLASISLIAAIKDAKLPPLADGESSTSDPPSLSAGLPHFSTGIWRNWGRDTFIALPGLLLSLGRFVEARQLILAYAGTLRHGLIPNLLAEGKAARYNCRDAVWFWLAAIVKYVLNSDEGAHFFEAKVLRLYPEDDSEYSTDKIETLYDTITTALNRHFDGISFRERNAGHQIDEHMKDEGFNIEARIDRETGFVTGGNQFNCGTWMDKMGSSDRANNRGLPATPRDGAAVELQGLALYVAENLAKLNEEGKFGSNGLKSSSGEELRFREWAQKLRQNFVDKFYIPEDSNEEFVNRKTIIKDSFGSTARYTDFQLRPNFCVALKLVPDIIDPKLAWKALEQASAHLRGPLGIKTLDESDWNYNGNYDNDNDGYEQKIAKGWNYHQGPEWLWLAAEYYSARLAVAKLLKTEQPEAWEKAVKEVKEQVQIYSDFIANKSAWSSLPELTNRNGAHCPHSSENQAWSVGCFIETLEILNNSL